MDRKSQQRYNTVVIVGTGMSGIAMAARLQHHFNLTDFHLYEKANATSGTWRQNAYPGCACDVPGAFYSFSFEPNYDQQRMNPTQPETKEYCDKVAAKYGVPERTTFGTAVYKAVWLKETREWRVWARNCETGEEIVHDCKILISAIGILDIPNDTFDVPGRDEFKGRIMHTTGWDHSVELEGKNVVIIGNGCTAAQLVPALLKLGAGSITQFFRSRHFYVPMGIENDQYSERTRRLWKRFPVILFTYRILLFLYIECNFLFFYNHRLGKWYRKRKTVEAMEFMEKKAPKKYYDLLRPDFDLGCKRRIIEGNYLESLHDDRVSLHQDAIASVTPTSVITVNGKEYPADVIALATGFKTSDYLYGIDVIGVDGVHVREHWARYGGPEAYNCSAMREFPNFFMLLGPNTAPGHTSALMYAENNVDYAINIMRPIITGKATKVELKQKPEDKWVHDVQKALKTRVWNTGCNSWYNRGPHGWNASTYPWTSFYYWYQSNFPNWAHWDIEYTPAGRSQKRRAAVVRGILLTGCLSSFIYAGVALRKAVLEGRIR